MIFVWSGATQALLPAPFLDLSLRGPRQGPVTAASAGCWRWRWSRTTSRRAASTSTTPASRTATSWSSATSARANPDVADHSVRHGHSAHRPSGVESQRRPAGVRSGRLSLHLDRRRRTAMRQRLGSVGRRAESGHPAGQDPADRRARGRPDAGRHRVRPRRLQLHCSFRQSLRRPGARLQRGLGAGHAQPVPLHLRSADRRPLPGRRRPEPVGGDQPHPRYDPGAGEPRMGLSRGLRVLVRFVGLLEHRLSGG